MCIISQLSDELLSQKLRFKGGTSLSKAHAVIERFSEDVDLILDWTRFPELGDPNANRSKTKQGLFNEMMNETAGRYVSGELRDQIQVALGNVCRVELDAVEPLNLHVVYPKVFADQYLSPNVKLEIGPLASWVPCETKAITSFVGHSEPRLGINPFEVTVIKAERTFWEKIEAIHHEHYRPEAKKHRVGSRDIITIFTACITRPSMLLQGPIWRSCRMSWTLRASSIRVVGRILSCVNQAQCSFCHRNTLCRSSRRTMRRCET